MRTHVHAVCEYVYVHPSTVHSLVLLSTYVMPTALYCKCNAYMGMFFWTQSTELVCMSVCVQLAIPYVNIRPTYIMYNVM